jgi:hypothetical protein
MKSKPTSLHLTAALAAVTILSCLPLSNALAQGITITGIPGATPAGEQLGIPGTAPAGEQLGIPGPSVTAEPIPQANGNRGSRVPGGSVPSAGQDSRTGNPSAQRRSKSDPNTASGSTTDSAAVAKPAIPPAASGKAAQRGRNKSDQVTMDPLPGTSGKQATPPDANATKKTPKPPVTMDPLPLSPPAKAVPAPTPTPPQTGTAPTTGDGRKATPARSVEARTGR